MVTEPHTSKGHQEYLTQRGKDYKAELEVILGNSRFQIPIGRDNCAHCDPRFKLVLAPEKTRNNMLLRDQVTFDNNHIIFRRDFKPSFKTLNPLLYESKQQTGDVIVCDDYTITQFPGICKAIDEFLAKGKYDSKIFYGNDGKKNRGYVYMVKKIN